MRNYKRWNILTAIIFLTGILLVGTLNYKIDPLQFYRKASYPPYFSDQERYQNPGLARNYDYNTIIIGTSLTENFLPSYIDKKFGVKTLKLSISGSTAKEQSMMANVAIRTGKVKNIIWGIDYIALLGDASRVADEFGPFPYYLYDNTSYTKVKYLLNSSTTYETLNILPEYLKGIKTNNPSIDKLYNWGPYFKFSKQSVLNSWPIFQNMAFDPNLYNYNDLKNNFDQNIFPIIAAHKNIKFYLYFPPYSILLQKVYYNNNVFNNFMKIKKYILEKTQSYPNVKIYDFQDLSNITFNLNNYKDAMHHSPQINNYIIDSMAKDQHLLTKDNVDKHINNLTNQVKNLNLAKMLK